MQPELDLIGGFHAGPLFVIRKERAAKQPMRGIVRHRVVKQHTPPWVERKDFDMLRTYRAMLIVLTGEPYDMDHIVPLNHPLVCGLHCPANIQILPSRLNRLKGNRHWPDMPMAQCPLFE